MTVSPVLAMTYSYDELGRLTSVTYDSGQISTYSYDAAGNITNIQTQSPLAYKSSSVESTNKIVTLTFTDNIVNNLTSLDDLKNAITFATDGTTFIALGSTDVVTISGETLIVTFNSALSGSTNKIKVAANTIMDTAGEVLDTDITTEPIGITVLFIPPTITTGASITLGSNVNVTFTDDSAWRNAIAGMSVDGVVLDSSKYNVVAGTITIDQSIFSTAKDYTIVVTATGYSDVSVTQSIVTGSTTSNYTVSVGTETGGSITASPTSATSGTAISLAITPDAGMQMKAGTLNYNDGTNHAVNGTSFTMPEGNVTVTAEFEMIPITPPLTFTVSTGTLTGGNIAANPTSATSGTAISLTITPDTGMQMKAGTLKYSDGTTRSAITITGTSFTMPAANVTVSAVFEPITITPPVTYTVTFNSQGGSTVMSTSNVTTGSAISAPTVPTWAGHTFNGWYKESGCTNAWNFSTDTVTNNLTLYAKWTANPAVTVSSVTVKTAPTKVTYTAGDPLDLTGLVVTLSKSDATSQDVAFADFAANGISTVKANGDALVIADTAVEITVNGKTASQAITVNAAGTTNTLQSIAITTPATKLSYNVGDTLDITGLVVTGKNSDNSTTPEAITLADVSGFDSSAVVASQTLTITVGGKTATYTISIAAASVTNVPVTGVTLNQSTLSLTAGGSNGTLNASVMPANATNQVVTWSSSNPSAATVNNGVVTPVAAGNATITVTTQDGNKTATCAVTVASPITTQVVTADTNNKHLAVTASTPDGVTINIPSNVTGATINVATLPAVVGTLTTNPLPALNIAADTSISASPVQVAIPAGTTVSAPEGWDGTIRVPTVQATNSVTVTPSSGTTATVDSVIEIGFGDVPLTFNHAVRLLIPGQAGKKVGYVRNGTFYPINTVLSADDQSTVDSTLAAGQDGYLNVGSDLVIWTKHFTRFVTYTETPVNNGGGSSNGGSSSGGGGSYSPTPIPPSTPTPTVSSVQRLFGQNRVDTALEIAKANYTTKLSNVVLATAENYPDALAGSVLAYKLNAPILLVGSSDTDQEKVLDYMKSNMDSTGTVYILGGTAVVSSSIEGKVTAMGFANIIRLGGTDRYDTSVKIADQMAVKTGTPIVLAYGDNYPDALAISSSAAGMQSPILLVQKEGISDTVKQEINKIMPSKVYIIGGTGVISTGVESEVAQITSLDKTNIVRIAGTNRYETSLAVAQYFNLSGQSVCIATGNNFPDALAGSVYAANRNAPIILADGNLSDQVINYLKSKILIGATLFGGEAAVSKNIEQQLGQLIGK